LKAGSRTTPEALDLRWSCQHESRMLNLEDIFVELSRN
jgi:hypothetical protein